MFASPFTQNQRTSAPAPAARIDASSVADYVRDMQDALLSSVGADDMMGRVSSDWGARSRSAKARGTKRAPQAYTGFAMVH